MPIIDQRILIPASQTQVWKYLSDLSRNAEWQADCRSVSFLSSKREGPGTRWRVTTEKAQQHIYEIQSWYNGLGYEYTIVDGTSMTDTKGRIRLQEIAEGTVVQWTFSFETKGVLSGLRGGTRQVEASMAASLKALYKAIKAMPKEAVPIRSLMQDSPDVEGRQQYQPRYTPAYDVKKSSTNIDPVSMPEAEQTVMRMPPIVVTDPAVEAEVSGSLFVEPPVKQEDTKPNPILVADDGANVLTPPDAPPASVPSAVKVTDSEPDFMPVLDDMLHNARPSQVETTALDVAVDAPLGTKAPAPVAIPEPEPTLMAAPTLPLPIETIPPELLAPPSEPEPSISAVAEMAPVPAQSPAPEPVIVPEPVVAPKPEPIAPVVVVKSIWEELGLPRPENLEPSPLKSATSVNDPVLIPLPPVTSIRQGFRAQDRRRIVRVRFPQ